MILAINYEQALYDLLKQFDPNLIKYFNKDNYCWGKIKIVKSDWYAIKTKGFNYFMEPKENETDNCICSIVNRKTNYNYWVSKDETMLLIKASFQQSHVKHVNFYIFDLSKKTTVTEYGINQIIGSSNGVILDFK